MGNDSKKPAIKTVEESNWNRPHELLYNIELKEEQIPLLENFKFGETLRICFFKSTTLSEYQQFCIMNDSWVMQFGKEKEIKENLKNLTPSSKLKICIILSKMFIHYNPLIYIVPGGQLISKAIYGVLDSPKKRTKKI